MTSGIRTCFVQVALSTALLLAAGCGGGGGGGTTSTSGTVPNVTGATYVAAPAAGGASPQFILASGASNTFTFGSSTTAPAGTLAPSALKRLPLALGGASASVNIAYVTMSVSAQTAISTLTGELLGLPSPTTTSAYGLEIDDVTSGSVAKIATVPGELLSGFATASFNNTYAVFAQGAPTSFVVGHTYVFQYYSVSATFAGHAIPTNLGTPNGIMAGSDGALWFTELVGNKIGRITTAAAFTEFTVPTTVTGGPYFTSSGPSGIAAGPDSALWFTEVVGNKIGRISTSGSITEFAVPTTVASGTYGTSSAPQGIAAGSDGALWFTELAGNKIGRISTTGTVTEFPVPTAASSPSFIASGPDGALWFTEAVANKIGRITVAGTITEFPIPTATSAPGYIVAGPDGALWFSEVAGNKIGRISTAGAVTEYPLVASLPGLPNNTQSASGILCGLPEQITVGADGALWFAENTSNCVGRITTSGEVLSFQAGTTAPGQPEAMTAGPDGAIWYTSSSTIVRLQ